MELRQLELASITTPVVLRNQITLERWPLTGWSVEEWKDKCSNFKLVFRIHALDKPKDQIQWENEAIDRVHATLDEYFSWKHDQNLSGSNPFINYDRNRYWAYSSYNYISQFEESSFKTKLIESINWSNIGLTGSLDLNGLNSSFWFGSKFANTPCHYDSYGYNLVAQIKGRKRWILFPPTDTKYLYPTRIPYEESSVFSDVDITDPDLIKHSLFKHCHPYIVVLNPRDILYVPYQWWHFVECIDDESEACISVNTWLPFNVEESSLNEAIVRFLTTALFPIYEPEDENWLNEAELFKPEEAIRTIKLLTQKLKNKDHNETREVKIKESNAEYVEQSTLENLESIFQWQRSTTDPDNSSPKLGSKSKDIVNCILDPDVIKLISDKIKEKL